MTAQRCSPNSAVILYELRRFRTRCRGSGVAASAGSTGAMGMSTSYQGFDSGGFTGVGGKNDPAGVVHKGEFVFTKEATERIGVSNLYDMMRGYADGGLVTAPTERPVASGRGAFGGSPVINIGDTVVHISGIV